MKTKLIFVLFVAVTIYSCKKEESVEPAPVPSGSGALGASTKKYIKFTLGGVNYNLTAPSNGAWAMGARSIETNSGLHYYKTWDTYQPAPGFTLCVSDTTQFTSAPVSDIWFKQFLTTKSYSYSPQNLLQNYKYGTGIYMTTADNSSVFWYSVNPVNPSYQNGSTFQIIEKQEYNEAGQLNIIFKATFNCKMYNSTGDSLALTNGEMIVRFSNW